MFYAFLFYNGSVLFNDMGSYVFVQSFVQRRNISGLKATKIGSKPEIEH